MENIKKMLEYMPEGYEIAARSSGAMSRAREIKSARDLLELCLVYLYKGLSLLEVSVYASVENVAKISGVNFMKRFGKCGGWFRSIAAKDNVLKQFFNKQMEIGEFKEIDEKTDDNIMHENSL